MSVLVPRAHAQPSSGPITYQGRLEQGGVPVSEVRGLRFGLFAEEEGGSVLTSVTVPNVEIVNGLFTATVPFPAGAFEGEARYLEITLLPRFVGEQAFVLPRQLLGSTPRAESVRGLAIDGAGKVGVGGAAGSDGLTVHGTLALVGDGVGVRFADGTVQTTAAIAPLAGPELVYLPGTAPVVTMSGEPVTLAEPITVSYDVAETQIISQQIIIATVPGRLTVSPVVVRRPFTGATNWRDLHLATIAGGSPPAPANVRSVQVLSLTPGNANNCSFTVANLMAVGYRIVKVGTQAFEELRLQQTTVTAPVPTWTSGATGNGARFEGGGPLGVNLAGAAVPGVDVLSYVSEKEAVATTGTPGSPTTFVLGRTLRPSYVFRTAFGSSPAVGAWFANTPVSAAARHRAFSITGPGGFTIPAYANTAWIHSYRLVPGPGGELTEEWSVTSHFLR
jgi:hypothetical protein